MINKARPKGLLGRPLSLTTPLTTLLPVIGTGNSNRIYRAEEATAPAEAQTVLLSPAAQSTPAVVLAPQLVQVILPLGLSPDSPAADPQSTGLSLPLALPDPATGLLYALAGTPLPPLPEPHRDFPTLHQGLAEPHPGLPEPHQDFPEPLALRALTLETQQRTGKVAFQNGPDMLGLLDLNQDTIINPQDAQVLYYLALNPTNLITLLSNLNVPDPSSEVLRDLDLLNSIAGDAVIPALDLNLDGSIDSQDARILYYACRFADILQASPTLRETLLSGLTVVDDRLDADLRDGEYLAILDRAAALKPPVDVDEPPTAVRLSPTEVTTLAENADTTRALKVADINVTDEDGGLPGLELVGPDALLFELNGAQTELLLMVGAELDFETNPLLEVTVQVMGNPAVSADLSIPVTNVPEAPTAVRLSPTEVTTLAENADTTRALKVADINVTDEDGGLPGLELVGPDALLFELNGAQTELLLMVGAELDFETNPLLEVTVQVMGNPAVSADLSIPVTNVPEAPTAVVLSPTEVTTLAENADTTRALKVADINVTDEDGGLPGLELVGADALLFELNGAQTELLLMVGAELDFETNPLLEVTVQVMGNPAVSADLSIPVTNVPEAPTAVTLSNPVATLDENTVVRTRVADIDVTDADGGARMLELIGDDAGLFELNSDQDMLFLRAGQVLDFEGINNQLDVTVQVMGNPAVSAGLSITLNDVPEAPTEVTLSNPVATLDENTVVRTRVADIDVTDADGGARMLELVGDDAGLFELNSDQDMLFLRAGQVLDFEGGNTQLDVTVQVMGNPAVSAGLSITLNDVPEAPTEVTLSNQVVTLDENTSIRTRVADIEVVDADGGARMLELVGDDAGLFDLNGDQTQLFLRAGQVLDFESANTQLDVTVQVMGNPAVSAGLSITLNDVPEAPTAVTLSNPVVTLDENTVVRTRVADIEVVDADGGARMLELVGDDAGLFDLNGDQTQLFLRAGQVLDFEGGNTQLDVTVQVMGNPAVSAGLSITLNDVPEAPTEVTLSNPVVTLDENTVVRTRVADIDVTDADGGARMLELVGDDAGLFELNSDQDMLFLRAGQVLDFEGGNTQLDVTVQVMGNPAVSAGLSITLNDVPEAPTEVTLSNPVVTLDENTSVRTRVADIEVVDADGGARMLELVGDDAGLFELNSDQDMLFLRAGQVLDFESANTQLDVTVQVMGNPAVSADLSIPVTNVPEAPTEVTLSNPVATLDENTVARTRVADIDVTDADGGARMLELVGDDAGLFELNGDQTQLFLRAGQVLDFEGGNTQLDVTVQVMGNPAVSAGLSITLNDVPEAPTAVTLSNPVTTLDENTSARTRVADIEVVDADGGARMLELVGDDAGLFELNGDQTQLFLRAGQVLDFEGGNTQLDVTVQVMGSSPAVNAPLSITLNDVPEAPTAVTLSNQVTTLDENTVARTRVADIEVVDADGGARMLELVGDDAGLFELNGDQTQLFLRAGQVLDFEGGNTQLDVTVQVVGSSPAVNAPLSITLNDVPEAPTTVTLSNPVATLDENTVVRTRVADIDVTDADGGARMLELIGDDAGLFELNGDQTQLFLRAGQVLDFEGGNTQLDVTVQVMGNPAVSAGLSITLNDVPEAPTAVTLSNPVATLDENTSVRTRVADIEVVDADGGARMLELVGDDAGLFELNSDQDMLFLRAGQVLDFESANTQLDVTVQVIGSSPAVNAPLSITLNDVPEAPTAVTLSNPVTTLDENTVVRTRVADIEVVDADGGARMLELVGDDAGLFELNGDQTQLFLRAGQVLDFEGGNTQLDVTVQVMGNPAVSAGLSITLNDVPEAPTAVTLSNQVTTLDENTSIRTRVADIEVVDSDGGARMLELVGDDAGLFDLNGDQTQLFLRAGQVLDFESANIQLDVTVQVMGNPAVSAGLSITLNDVPEVPTAVTLSNPVTTLDENTVVRTRVADIEVVDADGGARMLELVGDDAGLFELNSDQDMLFLRAGQVLDFEGGNTQLDVTVQVIGSSPAVNAPLSITLNDVPEAPTEVTLSNPVATLDENTVVRTRVADIEVVDADGGARMLELVGDDAGLFELNSDQDMLFLRAGQVLDFESANTQLDVTVQVIGSSPAVNAPLSITLNDVPEAPTEVTLSNPATSLDENTSIRTRVADIDVTDADGGARMLELVGDDAGLFELNSDQDMLFLRAGQVLDFESANTQLDVTVQVMGSSPAVNAPLSITLNDVPEAPTAVTLSNPVTSLDENTSVRTRVADIEVVDADGGARMLELVGDDAGLFDLNGDQTQLFLRAGQVLDFESANTQLDVTVQVIGSSPAVNAPLSITLNDVPEAPTAVTLSNQVTSLDENTSVRTRVADIEVVDADGGARMLELVGDDAGLFDLNGDQTQLFLRAGQVLDFESANTQLDVTVQVIGSSPAVNAPLSITLNDVPEAPTAVTLSNQVTSLDENTSIRTRVADIDVTDADGGARMLELVGDDAGLFELNGDQTQLFLRAGQVLDFESANIQLDVTVQVMGNPAVSAGLSITLNDVPEAPTAVTLSNPVVTLDENTVVRTRVADIEVVDADGGARMLELVGDDAGLFDLNGDQTQLFLRAGQVLDFESANTQLDVTVQVIGSSPAVNAPLSITLNDVPEAPTAVTLSNQVTSLDENTSVRTRVADIEVVDADGGARMLELVGDDAGLFDLNGDQTQLFLRAGQVLDFEGGNTQLDVTVQVMGNPAVSAGLSIPVTNVPEAPTAVTLSNPVVTLDENTVARTRVADIEVVDADGGARMLELVGDDAGLFELNGDQTQLFLRAGQVLDFEGGNTQLDVTVQVMGNPAVSAGLSITLNDVPEAPTAVTLSNPVATLDENTSVRTRVADIEVVDADGGARMLELVGDDAGLFELNSDQDMLFLRAGQVLDFEGGNTQLDVTVQVMGNPAVSADLSIPVTNVPEAPTAVTLSNPVVTLDENTVVRTRVADIEVVDVDGGARMLELVGDDAGLFELSSDQTQLFLRAGQVLDFESANTQLDVTVQVMGNPAVSAGLSIPVTNVPEAPTAVTLSNPVTSLDENTSVRTRVADIDVTDADGGARMLELVGDDAGLFELNGDQTQLFLRAGQVLDFESANTQLDVTVQVMGNPAVSADLSIPVTNVPEAPTEVTLSNQVVTLDENTVVRTRAADIEVVDVDGGARMLELVGDDAGLFELSSDQTQLFLRAGQVLDFEGGNTQLDVTVQVMGNPAVSADLSITLNDVPEAPTAVTLSNPVTSLDENTSVRTRVADIEVVDADGGARMLELIGDDAGLFELNGDQTQLFLRAGQVLDFEGGNTQLDVTVQVMGNPAVSAGLSITLNDVPEAPTAVTLSNPVTTLDENTSARTRVADIEVVDADGGARMLELVGDDAGLFELNGDQTQLFLRAGQVLDFEGGNTQLDVTVQVMGSSPAVNAPLSITLNDVPEAPTAVTLSNQVTTLDENTVARTRVADIEVVDADGGARMLELVGDDAGLFELNGDQTQLFLRAGQVLDFESANTQLDVTVQVIGSSPAVNAPLSITLNDVPEAPTTVTLSNPVTSLDENTSVRTRVADIDVVDADGGARMLELIGDDAGLFDLNGDQTQLFLRAGQVLDFESANTQLDVTVQVMGNPAVSADLSIPVTNVPEAPTEVTLSNPVATLDENTVVRTRVADIDVTDADGGARMLELVGDDAGLFELNGDQTQLFLRAGQVLDFESANNRLDVTVQVIGSSPAVNAPLSITLNDVPEAPTAVTLSNPVTTLDENTVVRTRVADIEVVDADGGARMLELVGDDAGLFDLNGDQTQLFLRAGQVLDFEGGNTQLDVTVQVMGNPAVSAGLSITLNDVPEAPTAVTLIPTEVTTLAENADTTRALKVADINVTDEDGGLPGLELVGPDALLFELNGTQTELLLIAGAELDYESNPLLEVTVQVMGNPAVSADLSIPVTNVDEPPTEVTLSNPVATLDENTSVRTQVADIEVVDTDGDARMLELVGDDAGLFELNGDQTQLFLRAGQELDFEGGNTQLDVTVQVMGNPGVNAPLSIMLNDVNEAPTTGGDAEFTVVEGASYTLTVDDLAATDIDISDGAAELTWTVMPGADSEPANGSLELITAPGTAIDSFTQAQLEAGEVVYVHDDSNTLSDGFTLQVADDEGFQAADPVIVSIDITRKLDSIDLSEPIVAEGFIIQGDAPGDYAGVSVSGAGDVNGDGFADLIVGAHRGDDGGGSNAGEAYVVFGKASTPQVVDLTNLAVGDGFIIQGESNNDQAGRSVSGAGDVNGDGFADLIVGAPMGDDGGISAGEAYLVFGKENDFGRLIGSRRVIDLDRLAPVDGFIIQGESNNDQAGRSVSGAGDVNGDGFADLIVGAYRGNDGGAFAGEAYLVFGKADGFGNPMGGRRVIDLTNLAVGDGFIIQGDADNDQAGRSVSSAGDVNGDGYADLIVGARQGDDGGSNAGEAYLVFGKASGFGSSMGGRRVIDLANLAAGDGFIIQGDADNDQAGVSVSSAGDVNGDGFADLIVGANLADFEVPDSTTRTSAGEAYIVFGKASGPSDPFGSPMGGRQVINLDSLAAADGFIIRGAARGDFAGHSVSGAGDVNGDGFADLLVGAYRADVTTSDGDIKNNAGEAYLVFGKASGPSDPFGSPDGNRQVVDLDALAPEDGFIIQGDAPGDYAGYSVSAAGDVNGDGFADLLVGANRADVTTSDGNTRTNAGEAYVLFGGPAGLSAEAAAVPGTDGDDVLNADGQATVVLAGAGDDVLNIDGFGPDDLLKFDGGTGTDTLRLNGADLSLDLSTLADTRLSSIERIDLNGGGPGDNNSLNLTRLDLLSLSEVRIDGRAELRVDGNNGDRITVSDNGWVARGTEEIADVLYNVFDNGNARLLVNTAIDIGESLRRTVDLSEITMEDGFIIQGDAANDRAGISVSGAGDVNGDGYADLIVGAYFGDDGGGNAGEAYVVFGKSSNPRVVDLTSLAAGDGFIIQGDAPDDRAGRSVSGAGDVNGDGFADLIVGARLGDDGGRSAGEVYLVFGKEDDFGNDVSITLSDGTTVVRRVIDLESLAPADGFIIQGDRAYDNAGISVSDAGDVNGDGFADLIVGAYRGGDGGHEAGEAYLVFGKEGGFGGPMGGRQVVDLTNLVAGDGFIIQGDVSVDRAGRSVSSAGDVNGDGYADLLVGAPRGDDGGNEAGEAYLIFGKADGFGTPIGDRRVVDLTSLAVGDGFIIQGDEADGRVGMSVSGAGDVNGDGYADFIVGANLADVDIPDSNTRTNAGEAYVVFGKASGPSDPFGSPMGGRQVINLESLAAADGFIIQGDASGDNAGISVSGVGDVNGDGFADLLVGARQGDDGGTDAGEAYVVFGRASGPSDPFRSPDGIRRVIDLNALAPADGFIIQGDASGDNAGISVSGAGDVNGDGFADLFVGANRADVTTSDGNTKNDAGEAYILFGGPAGLSTEAAAVPGTYRDDVLNADGQATVVLAGAGDDVLNIDGFGPDDLLKFDGGTGTDTLRLNGADLSLDLSTLADTRLSSIERIDLNGGGPSDNNNLSLTRLDLLSLSEVRIDGRAELRVDGNDGDRITVSDNGWVPRGREEIADTLYNVFDNGNARLLVNTAIDISGIRLTVDLSKLAREDGFIIQGDEAGDNAGHSVSGVGDVNGDGFADFIVGARNGDDGGDNAGEAYVVFGKASNPRAVDLSNLAAGDGFIIQGDEAGDRAGFSVSGAGDVNGDGYADLLVGVRDGNDGGGNAGEAYLVFGKASGPSDPFGELVDGRQVVDLSNLAAGDGFIIQGDEAGDRAGHSVSSAGDVNGDGYADLIIGAPQGDDGANLAGEAYLVFGKASGPSDPFGSPDGSNRPVIDLSSLAAGDGFIIQGDEGGDNVGHSVSGAGDVNGDGYADLIIGAPFNDDGGNNAGLAYVVFGKQDNFGSADGSGRQVIGLSSLVAGEGFVIQGDTDQDQAGRRHISGAGDVNGDGYADLIIGVRGGDDGGTDAGEAYVVFGKASDPSDPFGELVGNRRVIDLSTLSAAEGFIIQGDTAYDAVGQGVSGAGDVNGDGYDDLLVGAPRGEDGEIDAGEAYVVFGKASDPSDPFGSLDGTNRRVVDLTDLTAGDGFTIRGDAADDRAGYSVSAAGDVNGDGFADLIVGANLADVTNPDGTPRTDAGEAYVLFGSSVGLATEAVAELGTAGDDLLNAAGEATVVLAGAGNDVLTIDGFSDTDLLRFDGGSGTDTLSLANLGAGTGLSLDLSTLADTRLSSIERIDLSGDGPDGNNTLTLTRLDLLNLSEVRTEGRAELRVDGNDGDRVTASDNGWVPRGREEIADVLYNVFDNGNARLLVNTAIDIGGIRLTVDLSELAREDGFIIQGDADNDQAGISVSDAGDVNGDGYADLIVGVRDGDDGGGNAGEAYVVFGKASNSQVVDLSNLAAGDGFIIQGDTDYDAAGHSVSGAGDVNGDGYADLIVGSRDGDDGGGNAGEAYVVFGKASGPSDPFGSPDSSNRQVIDLTNLAAGDGFIIQGDTAGDNAGFSVSGAGDVNGDGYTDLIIGARLDDEGGNSAGQVYLVFGKASDPSDPFGSPDGSGRQVIDLTNLAAGEGFIIRGDMAGDQVGQSVSGAGDVNGDGYADLIIGAAFGDDGGNDAGEAYLVFGKQDNFGSAEGSGRVIDLSSLGAADGFIIQGDTDLDQAGRRQISGAGDVNGDGYADLIIGARGGDDGGTDAGEAYVVFGKASDPSDPFGELVGSRRVIDLSTLSAADGFIIQGDTAYDAAGQGVSGAGDVNGDGYDDLLVGAPRAEDGEIEAGEAYILFGKASDPSNPFGSLDGTNRQVVDLTDLTAGDGFTIRGDAADDRAGYSVSGAGDVNGDGFADLIVGANLADVTTPDGTRTDAGEAYVLFGSSVGLTTEAAAELGMDGDDVLNVDGQATVVLAGAGDDVLNIDGFGDTDLLKFDGGTGTDTLRLVNPGASSSLSLDLSTLADTRLSSIEHIDLSGEGDNSLILTRLDLLNLSEVRTDGRAELRVDGNTGDSVTAPDDGWAQGGDVMIEGTMYRTFDNGNARLLVNMDVSLGGELMATSMATSAALLQNCCVTQTVDIRAFIEDLPPEDEAQQRKRLEDELAMLGPLPAAKAAMELEQPAAVAEPDADLFDLPPLSPDDG